MIRNARITSCLPLFCTLLSASLFFTQTAAADESVESTPQSHSSVSIGGDYIEDSSVPDQELTQMTIPLLFTRETEDYVFEFNVPYIQRSAPSGKVAKSHHHESKNDSATLAPRVTNAGLGDVSTSLQRMLLNEKNAAFSLSAKGEVKFGTADVTRGLGTGMNDYFVEIKAKKTLEAFTGNASIGYAKFGSPGEVEINDVKKSIYFKNIYFGSVGGAYQMNEDLKAGLNLEMGQAAETGGYQQRDLSASTEYKYSPNKTVRMRILKSITPGISSWGLSASLATEL